MRKLLFFSFLLLPSVVLAQRFGTIKSSNDVSLSTNTILNSSTLQVKEFVISTATVNNTFTVNNVSTQTSTSVSTATYNNVAIVLTGTSTITWPDGTVQISSPSAVGGFDVTFNADQAKLPAANMAVISNPTTAVVSSLLFDASTDESVTWSTVLNPFPSGTLKVKVYYTMASATSGSVYFDVSLMCISDADAADIDTESFDTVGSSNTSVSGTAGYLDVMPITPSGDSCAAGDIVVLKLSRDANNLGDDAAGDAEVRKVRLYAE